MESGTQGEKAPERPADGKHAGNPVAPLLLLLAGVALYRRLVRPWYRHWGASREEIEAPMPLDGEVQDPNYDTTHAITIAAPPAEVWPWLVQMGQGRGGLYTYDLLENLAGLSIHSADRVIAELQHLRPGDVFPLAPGNFGPTVAVVEPDRLLALLAHADSEETAAELGRDFGITWVFMLKELENEQTRLIVRWRAHFNTWDAFKPAAIMRDLKQDPRLAVASRAITMLLGPGAFVMERGMLLGIKKRVERARRKQQEILANRKRRYDDYSNLPQHGWQAITFTISGDDVGIAH